MGDHDERDPRRLQFVEPGDAALLEPQVADREDLVDQQDLRIDVDGGGKRQPQRHAGAVGAK